MTIEALIEQEIALFLLYDQVPYTKVLLLIFRKLLQALVENLFGENEDGAEILIKEKYWRRPRKITLTEAKLLMGFNDYYAKKYGHHKGFPTNICSKAQSYKQFGNSVVPKIVEEIGNILIKLF